MLREEVQVKVQDDGGFGHEQSETAKQGLFVQGFIQDQPVEFLIDTGASETFISLEKYRQLSRAGLPILMEDTMGVNLANGEPIPVAGKMQLNVQLGEAQACDGWGYSRSGYSWNGCAA